MNPPSDDASHYHIHPDIFVSMMLNLEKSDGHPREFLEVVRQIPSAAGGDMEAVSRLTQKGYQDMRIVTRRGSTILKFDITKMRTRQKTVEGLTISKEEIYEFLKEGINEAILKVFEKLNKHYQGVFTYEFVPGSYR